MNALRWHFSFVLFQRQSIEMGTAVKRAQTNTSGAVLRCVARFAAEAPDTFLRIAAMMRFLPEKAHRNLVSGPNLPKNASKPRSANVFSHVDRTLHSRGQANVGFFQLPAKSAPAARIGGRSWGLSEVAADGALFRNGNKGFCLNAFYTGNYQVFADLLRLLDCRALRLPA